MPLLDEPKAGKLQARLAMAPQLPGKGRQRLSYLLAYNTAQNIRHFVLEKQNEGEKLFPCNN